MLLLTPTFRVRAARLTRSRIPTGKALPFGAPSYWLWASCVDARPRLNAVARTFPTSGRKPNRCVPEERPTAAIRSTLTLLSSESGSCGGPHLFRMDATATRPHPLDNQTGHPLKAQRCRCLVDEPFGDKREGMCEKCGRQVGDTEMPVRPASFSLGDHSTAASKRRTR